MRWPRRKRCNGEKAARARQAAERRLAEQQARWPQVHEARDVLSEMVAQAMRGGRA